MKTFAYNNWKDGILLLLYVKMTNNETVLSFIELDY